MPSWPRVFADNQPITLMVNAVRALTLGDVAPAVLGDNTMFFVARAAVGCGDRRGLRTDRDPAIPSQLR